MKFIEGLHDDNSDLNHYILGVHMSRFSVGDIVKVREDLQVHYNTRVHFIEAMLRFRGTFFRVEAINEHGHVIGSEGNFIWLDEWLLPQGRKIKIGRDRLARLIVAISESFDDYDDDDIVDFEGALIMTDNLENTRYKFLQDFFTI